MKIEVSTFMLLMILHSCNTDSKQTTIDQTTGIVKKVEKKSSPKVNKMDSLSLLKESYKKDDIPVNEYLNEELKPIRENFKKINSISTNEWSKVFSRDIWGKSTEGGQAVYYYYNGKLYKIIERIFGEMGQSLNEYYLLNGKLSFVLEREYQYNRPFYYDSADMKEDNDNQVFDFNKSEISEVRNYFANEKLIHQINNQDCGSPFADDYLLQEQKRILADFGDLTKLSAGK